MNRRIQGFTLIELLVVITIIGILASVVLSSLNSARANARDAKRASEMRQFQAALELFRNNHGSYPCSTRNVAWAANRISLLDGSAQLGSTPDRNRPAGCSDMRPYMDIVNVSDPLGYTNTNDYLYRSVPEQNGTGYFIRILKENGGFCLIENNASAPSTWAYPSCF